MSSVSNNPLIKITQSLLETVNQTDKELNTLTKNLISKLSSSSSSITETTGDVKKKSKENPSKFLRYIPTIFAARALAVSVGVLAKGAMAAGSFVNNAMNKQEIQKYEEQLKTDSHKEQLERLPLQLSKLKKELAQAELKLQFDMENAAGPSKNSPQAQEVVVESRRKVEELKSQLKELKQQMKVSFKE